MAQARSEKGVIEKKKNPQENSDTRPKNSWRVWVHQALPINENNFFHTGINCSANTEETFRETYIILENRVALHYGNTTVVLIRIEAATNT